MKIRSDFVSNSSSSSFIVKLDNSLPDIFNEYVKYSADILNWKQFRSHIREMIYDKLWDIIYYALPDSFSPVSDAVRFQTEIRSYIRLIPDEQFVDSFISDGPSLIRCFTFPESVEKDLDDLIRYIPYWDATTNHAVNINEDIRNSYNKTDYSHLLDFAYRLHAYFEEKYVTPKIAKLAKNIHKLLSKNCSSWKFVSVVIDDSDFNEDGECKEAIARDMIKKKKVWGYGTSTH